MNISKFKPLLDRVLVERVESESVTSGGIIIPENVKEKPSEGVVKAVGKGVYENGNLVSMTVKEGDRVLFTKWSGSEVKISNKTFLVMKESDILGIIE